MKIQCSCGAKYSFEVTPDMGRQPVRFVCSACGADSSEFVNQLVQRELSAIAALPAAIAPPPATATVSAPAPAGIAPPPPAAIAPPLPRPMTAPTPVAPAPTPVTASSAPANPPQVVPRASSTRLKVTLGNKTKTSTEEAPAAATTATGPQLCPKHPGNEITEFCRVCEKPLCPKCMEMFGYVCSPLCKAKADSRGINVPIYQFQKSVVEARQWRKIGIIGGVAATIVFGLLAVYIWYLWFGRVPHEIFAAQFNKAADAATSRMTGTNQIVVLHGATLSRYDYKTGQEIWSRGLISDAEIIKEAERVQRELREIGTKVDYEFAPQVPPINELVKDLREAAEADLELHVSGENIWIQHDGKLVRHDWETGQTKEEVALPEHGFPVAHGEELWFVDENDHGQHLITRLSLVTGKSETDTFGEAPRPVVAAANPAQGGKPQASPAQAVIASRARAGSQQNAGGAPLAPGQEPGQPLDPGKVAQEVGRMTPAQRAALPATVANARNQQRIMAELDDPEARRRAAAAAKTLQELTAVEVPHFRFIPSRNGHIKWRSEMVKKRLVARKAMKDPDPTAKSELETNARAHNTAAIANEILNEFQRDMGGTDVVDDMSIYKVILQRPNVKDVQDWVGEIVGVPTIHALPTVTVVTGLKSVLVLDKSNKKLWEKELLHNMAEGYSHAEERDEESISPGLGPCVERGETLYVYDEATLTAFDIKTGEVRWRVPSVGISGMFFDSDEMLYVNTSTADLDSIKYSRQIDITRSVSAVILKIDPKNGQILWSAQPGGTLSRVDGKFLFTIFIRRGDDELDPDDLTTLPGMRESWVTIYRLNPKNGKIMWTYSQRRAPLSMRFHGNLIEMTFKKEVQVLKFLTL